MLSPAEWSGIGAICTIVVGGLYKYLTSLGKNQTDTAHNSVDSLNVMAGKWSDAMIETAKINAEAQVTSANTTNEGMKAMASAITSLGSTCAMINNAKARIDKDRSDANTEREHTNEFRSDSNKDREHLNLERENKNDKREKKE